VVVVSALIAGLTNKLHAGVFSRMSARVSHLSHLSFRSWRKALEDRPPHRHQCRPPDCSLVHGASLVQIATGVTTEFRT